MKTYYFTFGTSPQFPFYQGWVEVLAGSEKEAVDIFNKNYPPKNKGIVNCAFIYSEESFKDTIMAKSGQWGGCHKVLKA